MSDSTKQDRIEELLRKSLLGEELVNTQFHLYSARSSSSSSPGSTRPRVLRPRTLCANNVLLAKSSKFFLDLFSSDVHPSDPSLIDLTHEDDVPRAAAIDAYGYGSDSDLDDCPDEEEPVPVTRAKVPKKNRRVSKGDESPDDGSDSDSSDMFVMSPEEPSPPLPLFSLTHNRDGAARSEASSETAVQDGKGHRTMTRNQTAMRLRSLGSRHVLVKDTAFQTWYTLLNYLYTDEFSFFPLSSATPGGQPRESSTTSSLDEPRCSAKSMYRLATKIGLDDLRDEAFSFIRSNLTEHNILRELSCSIVSTHPALLEMELDVLYAHIGSAPVVADFSALARRIASKELPQGADIVVGIHTRLLKDSGALPTRPSQGLSSVWGSKAAEPGSADNGLDDEDEDETEARPASPPWDDSSRAKSCGSTRNAFLNRPKVPRPPSTSMPQEPRQASPQAFTPQPAPTTTPLPFGSPFQGAGPATPQVSVFGSAVPKAPGTKANPPKKRA